MTIRPFLAAVALLLASLVVPVVGAQPASALVQPCAITYSGTGGAIQPGPGVDNKQHAWHAWALKVEDSRVVTDLDMSIDISHPAAQDLKINLIGPQTTPNLLPNVAVWDLGQLSGPVAGVYAFDDEAAGAKISGVSPSAGRYLPFTPMSGLEVPPMVGEWAIWLNNYGTAAGQLRSWSMTVTYATCDSDGDGIEEKVDNCRFVLNSEQRDRDGDGIGDECDDDRDGDAVANTGDGCLDIPAPTTSGCPAAARSTRARLVAKKRDLRVKVASYYPECQSGAAVTLWRTKKGDDAQVKQLTTNSRGIKTLRAPKRPGRYYFTVAASYAPSVAECAAATSPKVRVRRR